MKVSSRKNSQLGDFRISFRPKAITFSKPNTRSLKLYLEKNVQVIGPFAEKIPPLEKSGKTFAFSEGLPPIEFRIISEKFATYQVSVYESRSDGSEVFIEQMGFTLSKFLEEYIKDFHRYEDQLMLELKEKEGSTIAELWRTLIGNFNRRDFSSAVKFEQLGAVLDFICTPVHAHDDEVKLDDQSREKKRERKQKKNNDLLQKARTLSEGPHHSKDQFTKKYFDAESDLTLAEPVTFLAGNRLEKEHHLPTKEELKKVSFNFPAKLRDDHLSNIPEVEESASTIQVVAGLQSKSKVTYEATDSIEEKPQAQETAKKGAVHIQEEEAERFYELKNSEGYLPAIHIQNYRELLTVENHNYSKVGNLSLDSAIDPETPSQPAQTSKFKTVVFASGLLVLYGVAIVLLMHPVSRTG